MAWRNGRRSWDLVLAGMERKMVTRAAPSVTEVGTLALTFPAEHAQTIAHDEPRVRARAGHTKFGSDRVLAAYDPTFVFSCYQIHPAPEQPTLPCAGFWLARGFEPVTMHIPGMREKGEHYTFLAKKARNFQCPGRVHWSPRSPPVGAKDNIPNESSDCPC
jgi:hypothetical protein